MDPTIDSIARQVTISSIATFLDEVFAHPSHFPPQWAEPTVTALVSGIAITMWYAKAHVSARAATLGVAPPSSVMNSRHAITSSARASSVY